MVRNWFWRRILAGVEFGEERLMEMIGSGVPVDLLDEIWEAVDVFGASEGQSDDRTALHMQRA